jgi:hypothetical protein
MDHRESGTRLAMHAVVCQSFVGEVQMKTVTIGFGMLLLLLSNSVLASAQTPKYEVGGQIFSFQGKEVGFGYGIGGRFTYNLNRYIAVDSELNGFLADEGPIYAAQGFVGPKVGVRSKYVGVFAKARPGFQTNFARPKPDYATTFDTESVDKFAFDVGGVFEAYPTRHTVFRVDVSDVIIPFGNDLIVSQGPRRLGTTHNFQYSLGFSIRF